MPKKRYIISLSEAERQQLETITTTGKNAAYVISRARILLKANTEQPGGGQRDAEISRALNVSVPTIERLRRRFVEEGLEAALKHQPRPYSPQRRLDGEQEAHLIALACSALPTGQGRWSLRLLAQHMTSLGYVESISYETVRQTLKKTRSSRGSTSPG